MKTFEVNDDVAAEIEYAAESEVTRLLSALAQEFIDVSALSTPPGEKEFVHSLTGKRLKISAHWCD